jgi:hypothetical protein
LAVRLEDGSNGGRIVDIRKDIPGQSIQGQRADQNTWFNFGNVEPVGENTARQWDYYVGFWAAEGLRATPRNESSVNSGHPKKIHLALETPFVRWTVRNATLLPGDKVIFQFGENQICVFDPQTMRLALLCHGRGPVVVFTPEK